MALYDQLKYSCYRVFKANYFSIGGFIDTLLGRSPRFIWKSIWSFQILLKDAFWWKIEDGESVNAWRDPWVQDDHNLRLEILKMLS